jgi:hypothetical protein
MAAKIGGIKTNHCICNTTLFKTNNNAGRFIGEIYVANELLLIYCFLKNIFAYLNLFIRKWQIMII